VTASTQPDAQQIAVLIGTLTRLANGIDDLLTDAFMISAAFRAGREAGEEAARAALLGKSRATAPTPAARRARVAHLRPVDGGAS
jgi:hypothetical protein